MPRHFRPIVEQAESRFCLSALRITPTANPVPLVIAPPTGSVFPFVPAPGQQTAFEQARQRYAATYAGNYAIRPAQFTSQSGVLRIRALGISRQFLHGNIQMAVGLPATAGGPIVGAAFVVDKNLSAGNEIGLDMNFDPTSVNARGLPTRGAWATDPNIYSGADFVAQGSGTVTIAYSKNIAIVSFSGTIYTNGLTNPIGNVALQP
jgi:hypothetical protein